jgi:hypothetical protein
MPCDGPTLQRATGLLKHATGGWKDINKPSERKKKKKKRGKSTDEENQPTANVVCLTMCRLPAF